jgi:hypothetical protein
VSLDKLIGTYEGTGAWYDSAGKTSGYRVRQTNVPIADGFEVAFKHDFDDGTVVDAKFAMIWIAPNLFRVETGGIAIGNGYVFDRYCHYHMNPGGAFVEASYRASGEHLEVFGSSSRNAEGNYIAWTETLRRVVSSA